MRRRAFELGGVAVTAAVFLALPKPPAAVWPLALFIPACIGGWAVYAALRLRAEPALWREWGLGPTAHLRPIAQVLGPICGIAVLAGALWAVAHDRPLVPPWLWLSLLVYPVWGLVQQWLVQALVIDNARALFGLSRPVLVALGAIGFGAVHVSHPPLVVATAALGALYVALFQRWRNLWPLAVAHGWLGSLFYPWVLGMNPIEALIGLLS